MISIFQLSSKETKQKRQEIGNFIEKESCVTVSGKQIQHNDLATTFVSVTHVRRPTLKDSIQFHFEY